MPRGAEDRPQRPNRFVSVIQALQKTGDNKETPELMKKLAALKEQTTREDRERYRYRLADDSQPGPLAKP